MFGTNYEMHPIKAETTTLGSFNSPGSFKTGYGSEDGVHDFVNHFAACKEFAFLDKHFNITLEQLKQTKIGIIAQSADLERYETYTKEISKVDTFDDWFPWKSGEERSTVAMTVKAGIDNRTSALKLTKEVYENLQKRARAILTFYKSRKTFVIEGYKGMVDSLSGDEKTNFENNCVKSSYVFGLIGTKSWKFDETGFANNISLALDSSDQYEPVKFHELTTGEEFDSLEDALKASSNLSLPACPKGIMPLMTWGS